MTGISFIHTQAAFLALFIGEKLIVSNDAPNGFLTREHLQTLYPDTADFSWISHTRHIPAGPERTIMTGYWQDDVALPHSLSTKSVRDLFPKLDERTRMSLSHAAHLVHWDRNSTYCGTCGDKQQSSQTEHAKHCARCERTTYPVIAPAVIMRITDGDRILLAHAHRMPKGLYSVLAGFVNPGEALETTVAREVREETGLDIQNIRYFASQPWPFPNALMIGFTADYAGGVLTVDQHELEDAAWFTRDKLPPLPPKITLARQLIDDFLKVS